MPPDLVEEWRCTTECLCDDDIMGETPMCMPVGTYARHVVVFSYSFSLFIMHTKLKNNSEDTGNLIVLIMYVKRIYVTFLKIVWRVYKK